MHELRPSSACMDPAAQRRGALELVEHALPAGHTRHWELSEMLDALEYLLQKREQTRVRKPCMCSLTAAATLQYYQSSSKLHVIRR